MKARAIVVLLVAAVTTALGAPLKIVSVSAPAVHCKFDVDCNVTLQDLRSDFTLPGTSGRAFLQSRLYPAGEPGTPARGLYGYVYRIDLRELVGVTAQACVTELVVSFGPVQAVDYNSDGRPDHVFVITEGGLGSAGLASADQTGDILTFRFKPQPCSGARPGTGTSTFFFGLASSRSSTTVSAGIRSIPGGLQKLKAYAPIPTPPTQGTPRRK